MPQDHALFIILEETDIEIWKKKLAWIAGCGGMALLNTHSDYMGFNGRCGTEEYPKENYEAFFDAYKHRISRTVLARLAL